MNKLQAFLAAVALASSLGGARAATYDLAADFSHASNPNGVWSYGRSAGFGGAFTAFTNQPVDAGVLYWNDDPMPPDVPMIYFNPTSRRSVRGKKRDRRERVEPAARVARTVAPDPRDPGMSLAAQGCESPARFAGRDRRTPTSEGSP